MCFCLGKAVNSEQTKIFSESIQKVREFMKKIHKILIHNLWG